MARQGSLTSPPPASPIVGRGPEIARLRGHLAAARAGTPQVVFLEGDAGIGKSRLLRTVQHAAADAGVEVLTGRCLEHFDLPYLPFRSAILPSLAASARRVSDLKSSGQIVEHVLDAADGDALLERGASSSDQARLLHAAATITLAVARDQPMLITIDDLHWADPPSLDLLVQLVFEASDAAISGPVPLCIVATHRPTPNNRLGNDLARMLREEICHRVEVRPLDEIAATQLVYDLGLARASRQLVEAVLSASGGNPLLLESAVPQLLDGRVREEGGELVPVGSLEDLAVPHELSGAISARLDGLDPEVRDLLVIAAVVGDEFVATDLAAVAGVAETNVGDAIEVAITRELIVVDHDRIFFTHPMFARVLRSSTPARRRAEIHVVAAHVLRESVTPHDVVLTVGWHLAAAEGAADPHEAAAACRAAGERAYQLCAWADAARYFDAAVAAVRRSTEPPVVVAELLASAGAAHCRNLDPGPGRARLRDAIELYEADGNAVGAVRSWIELVHVQVAWGSFGQPIDLGPLEALLPEIEGDDIVLCARGYAQLAEAGWPQGKITLTEQHADRALGLAARGDDANARTRAHLARAQARWLRLDLVGALDALKAALESGTTSGDQWLEGIALSRLALTLFWLGRLDEAHTAALAALRYSETIANFAEQSLALAALTAVAVAQGEFEAAEEHAESAVAAIRLSRYTWSASLVFPALVSARLAQGDFLGAHSAIDQWTNTVNALDDTSYADTIELIELVVALHGDESDRVQRALLAAPHLADGYQPVFIGGVQRVAALVELAESADLSEAFPGWRASLDAALDRSMLVSDGLVMLLPRVRADLAALEGRLDDADAGYRDAIATAEAIGARPDLARAQLGLARLVQTNDPESARTLAADAAHRFRTLGMPVYEQQARSLSVSVATAPVRHEPASSTRRTESPRDTMVLLFTDVVDSTRLTEELGDEQYIARAEALDELVRGSIAACDGQPEDGIRPGDGLLAYFTRPEQAIHCATLAHEHAAASRLQLHIGIHVGEVVRARTGIHGRSVNLAARVCSMAPAGITLTSADLRAAVDARTDVTFEEFGVFTLKGIAEPQPLFVVRYPPTTN